MSDVRRLPDDQRVLVVVHIDDEQITGIEVEATADVGGKHDSASVAQVGGESAVGHSVTVTQQRVSHDKKSSHAARGVYRRWRM